jgi:hypothetical protein
MWGIIAAAAALMFLNNNNNKKSSMESKSTPNSDKNKGKVSFAVWNKNPLNIRNAGYRYSVEITVKDAVHKQFATWQDGTAVAITHLWRYINGKLYKEKLNTLSKIIYTWAPPIENDTEEYIRFISKRTGISRDEILTFDRTTIYKMVNAMKYREDNAAAPFITDEVFDEAWIIAQSEIKNYKK